MSSKVDLLKGNTKELFLKYLIPSVGGMMGTALYVLGDTIFVGRGLGSQGLAALNISIPLINVLNGLGLLFGIGGATFLSRCRGENKNDKVNDIFTLSMIMAFIAGLVLTLVRVFFLDELCYFLGASQATFQMSKDYLGVILSFSIPFVLNSALAVLVRNDGAPGIAMWSMLAGSLINLTLDYIFIFVFQWGMWGAALATGLSPVLGLMILSIHFIRKNNKLKLIKPKLESQIFKRIIANGSASFIVELSAGLVIFSFNKVILTITGDIGVSAYSIIANLSLIVTAIFIGISQAIQPIVSYNYGADRMDRVYESVSLAVYFSLGVGVLFYAIGMLFPEFLVSLFTKENPELMVTAARGIRIYFMSFMLMGLNIVMTSYIQSMEHAGTSTIISLTRGFGLVVAYLLILPKFFGMDGVWATLPAVELTTAIICVICFKKYRNALIYSVKGRV